MKKSKNDSSSNQTLNTDPRYQNVYSTEDDYRSKFTNITELNTYPHGNYINDYNTQYTNEEYRPLSAIDLNDLNETRSNQNEKQEFALQNGKYVELNADYPAATAEEPQIADQYRPNEYQSVEKFNTLPPPSYQQSTNLPSLNQQSPNLQTFYGPQRSNDYVINTPYSVSNETAKPNKNFVVRFCGQLFSILLIIFMLLLSFLLIKSFQANLTASYIAKHNHNEWRKD